MLLKLREMKKLTIPSLIIIFLFFLSSFNQEKKNYLNSLQKVKASQYAAQNQPIRCRTMEVLQKHLANDPGLKSKMKIIENHCEAFIKRQRENTDYFQKPITISTVVHVVYSNIIENISDAQIQSQIKVLNQDFTKTNPDVVNTPEEFSYLAADIKIRFELDSVIRVPSKRPLWGTDDEMKFSTKGGSNVVSPSTHLNIWVCNIGGGILGYAQFPGDNPDTDGIVISPQYFGTRGYVSPRFKNGRTATHEVGHWLNLRHIWGDGNCNQDDFVEDTPASDSPNFGCPIYPTAHCDSNDMTMNYMDYTNDNCMYMFTEGQKARMRAVFAKDGARVSFIQ